jgi:hypothetical protein
VVVTTFQAIAIIAALVGIGIPAWLFGLAVYLAAKRPRKEKPSSRFFAYARLLQSIHDQIIAGKVTAEKNDFVVEHGALFTATIRELKEYPEFRDLTLLYLEEINVTGSKKFDHVMRNELNAIESHLLSQGDS